MRVTFILSLFREELVRALFWTLVHSLWQGLALAILTGLVILLTRRSSPALRYNVLTGAFCIFLLGAGITFFVQLRGGGISSVPLPGAPASFSPVPPAEMPVMGVLFTSEGSSWAGRWVGWLNQRAGFIVTCWFIILFIRLVKLLTDLGAVQRLRYYRTSVPDGHWQQRVMELARQMGIKKAVGLLESSLIRVPMMAGMLKPVILVPLGLLAQLPSSQVEAILLHELAHIRRKDYLVNLLQSLAETLFFFNPAVIWISSLIREERENCCDDIAVRETRSKKEFIHALVSFQEYSQPVSRHAIAFPGARNHLLERIRRIVYNDNKTLNIREKFFFLACLLITAGLTLAYSQRPRESVFPMARQIKTVKPVLPVKAVSTVRSVKAAAMVNAVTRVSAVTPADRVAAVSAVTRVDTVAKPERELEREGVFERQQAALAEQARRLNELQETLAQRDRELLESQQKLMQLSRLQGLQDSARMREMGGTSQRLFREDRIRLENQRNLASLQMLKNERLLKENRIRLEIQNHQQERQLQESRQRLQLDQRRLESTNRTVAPIIEMLQDRKLITRKDQLSFSLDKNGLIVNGQKQPDEIFQSFRERFLHDQADVIDYSKKEGSESSHINIHKD